ncbi:hypothetical protein BKA70DRAFT_1554036 [Coprinopsis sp. MPI-PUGE-AT-0042]|nr:hypothetical protein BKA70DRAFT_1554036 [Coprinopsis sp. MPI-PUGE-AT-0042]
MMAHHHSTALDFDKRGYNHGSHRVIHRPDALGIQWQRYETEEPVPVYGQNYWSSEVYAPPPPRDYTNAQPSQAEYPESSQRTALSPSPQYQAYISDHPRTLSRTSTSFSGRFSDADAVFGAPASGASVASSRSPSAAPSQQAARFPEAAVLSPLPQPLPLPQSPQGYVGLKVEDEEPYGFVMEPGTSATTGTISFSPLPMEVPLRATQASDDMRKMMNVFRLNPFAVNNEGGKRNGSHFSDSSSGPSSSESSPCHLEARPLEEEPLIFEFQIHLDRPDILSADGDDAYSLSEDGASSSGGRVETPLPTPPSPSVDIVSQGSDDLHSFPPEFQLHKDDAFNAVPSTGSQLRHVDWTNQDFVSDGTSSLYSWDGDRDVDSNDGGRRSAASHHSGAPRLHTTISHPYLRRSPVAIYHSGQRKYPQPTPSPPHVNVYHEVSRFASQHGPSDYYHAPAPARMDATTGYYEPGNAPTAMLPHRTMAVSSSQLYTNEPLSSDIMGRYATDVGTYAHGQHPASMLATMTPPHRRWSMPESTSSGMLGSSIQGHSHGHIMVPSLPTQPFLVH